MDDSSSFTHTLSTSNLLLALALLSHIICATKGTSQGQNEWEKSLKYTNNIQMFVVTSISVTSNVDIIMISLRPNPFMNIFDKANIAYLFVNIFKFVEINFTEIFYFLTIS